MASQMRYCNTCGQRLPEGAGACPFCGADASTATEFASGAVAGAERGAHFRVMAHAKVPATKVSAGVVLEPSAGEPIEMPVELSESKEALRRESKRGEAAKDRFSLDALEGDSGVRPFADEQDEKKRSSRSERRLHPELSDRQKRTVKRVTIALAAVAVLAVVTGVGLSWKADMDLRAQAEQAAKSKDADDNAAGSAGSDVPAAEVSSAAQAGTGGASVVSDGVNLYWATGDGIYALPMSEATGDAKAKPEHILSNAASCLNIRGDNLYFLQAGSVACLSGVRSVVSGDTEDAEPEALYTAAAGAQLTGLVVRGDTVLALERADGRARVLAVADGKSETAYEATASTAWLFADAQSATLVTAADTTWQAVQAPLDSVSTASSWLQAFTGNGSLKAAFFAGTALYQSIEGDGTQAKVTRRETTGSFNEYTDLAGTVLLSGDSQGCAALTSAGGLAWIDADTGFSRDLTPALEKAGVSLTPSSTDMWCEGTEVYVLAGTSSGHGSLWSIDASDGAASAVRILE